MFLIGVILGPVFVRVMLDGMDRPVQDHVSFTRMGKVVEKHVSVKTMLNACLRMARASAPQVIGVLIVLSLVCQDFMVKIVHSSVSAKMVPLVTLRMVAVIALQVSLISVLL